MARMISQETESVYFDPEDPEDFLKLTNPKLMFRHHIKTYHS
ncbi:hypothetical protein QUF80_15700 [Desulfococcaceae bacterium HSG8]|nr:hypothetical protein [Desulfococcaceae bacterium HSG8]